MLIVMLKINFYMCKQTYVCVALCPLHTDANELTFFIPMKQELLAEKVVAYYDI